MQKKDGRNNLKKESKKKAIKEAAGKLKFKKGLKT